MTDAPEATVGGWHLVTCEYPPRVGGVASYSAALAAGLARHGCAVTVWCPHPAEDANPAIAVCALEAGWTFAGLVRAWRAIGTRPRPRRVIVQWVPHGYGYKSLNVGFVAWVMGGAWLRGDDVDVMVHEPWLAFEPRSARRTGAALLHRVMMAGLLRSARRAWVSVPAWIEPLRLASGRTTVAWLPVPSLLPVVSDAAAVQCARASVAPEGRPLVGHFGTYGRLVADLLAPALAHLLSADAGVHVLLLGQNGREFCDAFASAHPVWASRVRATGRLPEDALSIHVQACDVMLQPYPDGVSARRTTTISLLAHGSAVVTTAGALTEELWRESAAVSAVPPDPVRLASEASRLLADSRARAALRQAARELHARTFTLERVVATVLAAHDGLPTHSRAAAAPTTRP